MHATNDIFPSKIKRANETGKTQADILFDMIYISVFRLDLVNIINFFALKNIQFISQRYNLITSELPRCLSGRETFHK